MVALTVEEARVLLARILPSRFEMTIVDGNSLRCDDGQVSCTIALSFPVELDRLAVWVREELGIERREERPRRR